MIKKIEENYLEAIEKYRQGNFVAAQRILNEIISIDALDYVANYNLARISYTIGEIEDLNHFICLSFLVASSVDKVANAFWELRFNVESIDDIDSRELLLHELAVRHSQKIPKYEKKTAKQNKSELTKKQIEGLTKCVEGYKTKGLHHEATCIENKLNTHSKNIRLKSRPIKKLKTSARDEKLLKKLSGFIANNRYQLAVDLIRSNSLDHSKTPKILTLVGVVYYEVGYLKRATAILECAVELDPTLYVAHYNLGCAKEKAENYSEAVLAYERALELKPSFLESKINLAYCHYKLVNFNKAVSLANSLINSSKAERAYSLIGAILLESGKLEPLYALLSDWRQSAGETLDNLELEAELLNFTKDVSRADVVFKRLIEFSKHDERYKHNFALFLSEAGDFKRAREKLEELIDKYPQNIPAFHTLSNTLISLGEYDEAEKICKKFIELSPRDPAAHNNLGTIYISKFEVVKAYKCFETAVLIDPKQRIAIYNYANTATRIGNFDQAYEAYLKLLKLDKYNRKVWSNVWLTLIHGKSTLSDFRTHLEKVCDGTLDDRIEANLSLVEQNLSIERQIQDRAFQSAVKYFKRTLPLLEKSDRKDKKYIYQTAAALFNFGRSGTGLLHSLVDGHKQVSTMPSIYFSEFFHPDNIHGLMGKGIENAVNTFIRTYDVLFDSVSTVPIQSLGGVYIDSIGQREGLTKLGGSKDEKLTLDRLKFKECLTKRLLKRNGVNGYQFFEEVHRAIEYVTTNTEEKSTLFYHIHNPDRPTIASFISMCPHVKLLLAIREPIRALESWCKAAFDARDLPGTLGRVVTMAEKYQLPEFRLNDSRAIKLEDLKNNPTQTLQKLSGFLKIEMQDSMYKMTSGGKQWWGDPSSQSYRDEGNQAFGTKAINREKGYLFSDKDIFILEHLFYKFNRYYNYTSMPEDVYLRNQSEVVDLLSQPFDFVRAYSKKYQVPIERIVSDGVYKHQMWKLLDCVKYDFRQSHDEFSLIRLI